MRGQSKRRHNTGWLPEQHGAWAMLVVPLIVGVVLRMRSGEPGAHLAPLALTWLAGYFTFNAATLWLKAAPVRRARYLRPMLAYGVVAAAAGITTLVVAGPALLWWVLPFSPLLGGALLLAAHRHERSLLSGFLTVFAASLLMPVARFPVLPDLVGSPDAPRALATWLLVFGYFFGTVFYVKTMIRERGERTWLATSIAWHVAFTLMAVALAALGLTAWLWPVLAAATVVRSVLMPWLAQRRHVTPLAIGLVEIGMSAVVLTAALM